MNSEKWGKIKAVFYQAIELNQSEAEEFLQNLEDEEIRVEVEKLLQAEKQNNFSQSPVKISHLWQENSFENYQGQEIGGYKLLQEIGQGGMGVVFEALRQKDDFSQTVALKLLKNEISSEVLLRRFTQERQILASLEHPNIARLLDGGRTENGIPFFAMEFVKGKPIDEFCRENNLSLKQSLQLFLQVCSAVSFAHSRLIVHRDLKPSNILVTEDGNVKLLDFGISKVISEENQPQTVTSLGMMTPKYASPEQINGDLVSTSSDIYSLGLILYELLTGVSAYDFPDNRPAEMAKIICEKEPLPPSKVWREAEIHKSQDTEKNRTNPATFPANRRFSSSLKGDLDTIVLKALQKQPHRRYASVEQFANDIQRHLDGLPVIARPDTFSYRMEKFIKRNRGYVMSGTLLFLTLIAGITATLRQAYIAEKQRKLAEERFNQVRQLANNIVFKYYDEAEKLPNSTVIREMFVKDSLDYFDSLSQDSTADDALKSELGKAYLRIAKVQGRPFSPNLGQTTQAIENYRKGLDILEPLILNSSDINLQADFLMANADYAVVLKQKGLLEESNYYYQKAIKIGEEFLLQNPANETLATRLAVTLMFWGDSLPIGFAENENLATYRKALKICENLLINNPNDLRLNNYVVALNDRISASLQKLAQTAAFESNLQTEKTYLLEAKSLLEKNIEISKKLVVDYPNQVLPPAILASAKLAYGTLLIELEEYSQALKILEEAEKTYRKSLNVDQISVGQKLEMSNVEQRLAVIYSRTGKASQSDTLFNSSFRYLDYLIEKDADNFDYLKLRCEAKFNYGDELSRRGETQRAEKIYREAFEETKKSAEIKDSAYAKSLEAIYFVKSGNRFEGEKSIKSALEEYQKAKKIWQQNKVLNLNGTEQKSLLEVLQRKIVVLQNSKN